MSTEQNEKVTYTDCAEGACLAAAKAVRAIEQIITGGGYRTNVGEVLTLAMISYHGVPKAKMLLGAGEG